VTMDTMLLRALDDAKRVGLDHGHVMAWTMVEAYRVAKADEEDDEDAEGDVELESPCEGVAPLLTCCRASHLAEVRCLSSLWEGASPAKTHASSRPSRAYGYHLRPATNGESLREACCSTTTRLHGPATWYSFCSANGLTPCRKPGA